MCFELRASVTQAIMARATHIRPNNFFYIYFGFHVDPFDCIAATYSRMRLR